MKATKVIIAVASAAVLAAAAGAESLKPPALSGTVFAYYRYDLTTTDDPSDLEHASEFEISRCYVNVKGALTDKMSYRVTTDVGRLEDLYYTYELEYDEQTQEYTLVETAHTKKGALGLYAKYVYVDVKDVIPAHTISGGLEGTAWIAFEDAVWGWRAIRKVAVDNFGYDTSADLGVGVSGELFGGVVDHRLVLTNGAGYRAPEVDFSGKNVGYRVSVHPLAADDAWKGLSVSGYVKADNLGEKVQAGDAKNPSLVLGGLVALKHKVADFGAGYFTRAEGEDNAAAGTAKVTGNIVTAYATGHFPLGDKVTVHPLARYDVFEPNADIADDEETLLIGGVGFKFFDGALALIPNYQRESYKELDETTGIVADKSNDYVYLHCQWDWK